MATRMQQRRGTASQWTSANPILNAAEMGWESDTNKFKIGDGTNHWADLDYFIDANSTVNPSFGSSIVFEGATANDFETTLAITDPTADRTITFPDATGTVALTSDIAELSQDAIDTALTAGTGITKTYNDAANTLTIAVDTTAIQARVADVSDTEIGYLNGVTSAIQTQLDDKSTASKTETLTNKTLTTPTINGPTITATGQTPTIHGIYLPAPHNIIFEGTTADDFETTLQAGEPTADRTITLPDATGTVALVANVAALSGATFTGAVSGTDLTLSGNLTVNGTTTTLNSTTISVDDKNIELGSVETPSDATADGGGITLKGTTDKTFNWVDATDAWTSSEHVNLASGKSLYLNGTLLKDATETLTNKTINANANTITVTSANVSDFNEAAQDAIGTILGTGLSYNDAGPGIGINNAALTDYLLDGVSGSSYGLIGTSAYLDVKNTNGYNKEIELDIAAVKTQLNTDGYLTTSSTSTLTNKTLTSPKINEDVAVTATATELNYVDGVTSAIQTQLDAKVDESLFDTKGDILVASADNTPAKLAVGTNGYLLTANSSATNGVEWAAAPVSLPSQSGESGKYLTTDGTTASWGTLVVPITTGTATVTANTATTVDTTALSGFTSIEYMVSLKQGSKVRTSKVVVQTDGTSVDMTEFAITETGGTIAGVVVSAAVSSTNGVLQVTATDATTTSVDVKFSKVKL
jgi:hypothetical protein